MLAEMAQGCIYFVLKPQMGGGGGKCPKSEKGKNLIISLKRIFKIVKKEENHLYLLRGTAENPV